VIPIFIAIRAEGPFTPSGEIPDVSKNCPAKIRPGESLTKTLTIDTEILLRPPEGDAKFPELGHTQCFAYWTRREAPR
jgi:hypothetical protein